MKVFVGFAVGGTCNGYLSGSLRSAPIEFLTFQSFYSRTAQDWHWSCVGTLEIVGADAFI